jgi:hypothetical protein
MKKIIFAVLLSCGLMSANATIYVFDAFLSGLNEIPINASPANGYTVVMYDDSVNTLQVQALFAGLVGNTTVAHIHAPTLLPFAGTAGVATTTPTFAGFPAGITSGSYSNTLDLTLASSYNPAFVTANGGTTAGAQAALVAAMFSGRSYLNIHSSTYPGGEIRGFLTLVPEPSALALVGLGAISMVVRARKQRVANKE